MRVDESRVDPVGPCVGKLADIELARRQQHLLVLAVDGVAVHVAIVKRIVSAQRLTLGDGVVEWAPLPEAYVIEQGFVLGGVDRGVRLSLKLHFADPLFDAECAASGVDVRLDEGLLQRNLVGANVERGNRARKGEIDQQRQSHARGQQPAAHPHQNGCRETRQNDQPLQRQADI